MMDNNPTSDTRRPVPFVVAFTKDWDDVPTCTTHILREMAKAMPVLWVCSIGTRKPSAASGKDIRRIARRLTSGLKRAEWKENNLRVLNPILIPKAESALAKWINRKIFAWYVRREQRNWSHGPNSGSAQSAFDFTEYWCFVPNAVDLLPASSLQHQASRVVYYCADDWTKFHNLDGEWMGRKERELLERANVVFVTSRFLKDKFLSSVDACHLPPATLHYMPHGVEYARFSQALDKSTPPPADVAGLQNPIIGFYGNLHPWVDFGLIAALAAARPEWSFVLIGEPYADVSALESLPNVYLLGRREHGVLHEYCRAFDAAIIPYDMTNPRMESVNPVKTKEILAAGLPVVASDVPELGNYGTDVLTCTGAEAWLEALDSQVLRQDHAEISRRVREESWENKVLAIRETIENP